MTTTDKQNPEDQLEVMRMASQKAFELFLEVRKFGDQRMVALAVAAEHSLRQALSAPPESVAAVPVATVSISKFRGLENMDFQLEHDLPDGTHKLYLAPPAPARVPLDADARDAARWRRLINASEMAFPAATIAEDPENDCVFRYGRKILEELIDGMDEISDTAPAPKAAK